MSGQTIIINAFFSNNYQLLVQKCRDYSLVYNYRKLAPDELISELYLYTLNNINRTNKLTKLIELSAATLSKIYNYNSQAFYYIARILYNITHGHRHFDDNCNKVAMHLTYEQSMENLEIPDISYEELPDYSDADVIYAKALELSQGENWYKYVVWNDYYNSKMTYKQLSNKYHLTITPLFYIVQDYNNLIKIGLKSDEHRP